MQGGMSERECVWKRRLRGRHAAKNRIYQWICKQKDKVALTSVDSVFSGQPILQFL